MNGENTGVGLTEAEQREVDLDAADTNKDGKGTDKVDDKSKDDATGKDTDDAKGATGADDAGDEGADDKGGKGDDRVASAVTKAAEALDRAADRLSKADAREEKKPDVVVDKEPDWDAEKKALKEKYDKNELDDDAYEEQREALLERKTEWKAERRATKLVDERVAKQRDADNDREWGRSLQKFNGDPDNAKLLEDPTRLATFGTVLQVVAKENPNGSYEDWLATAKERLIKAFGLSPNKETDAERTARIKKETAERDAKAGKKPKDINKAPAAENVRDGENKFADLDAMDISDLENTLARMKPDALDEYLTTAPGGLRDNPRGG